MPIQTSQWLNRPIINPDDQHRLEQGAAIHEFQNKLPRHEAEQKAYDEYLREQRAIAAGHHLTGIKTAQASGDMESARQHGLLYELHMKALGLDPYGPPPSEVTSKQQLPTQSRIYRFKAHPGDFYALQEQPEASMSKSENLEKAIKVDDQEAKHKENFLRGVLGGEKPVNPQPKQEDRSSWVDYSNHPAAKQFPDHKFYVGNLWGGEPRVFSIQNNGNIGADLLVNDYHNPDEFLSGLRAHGPALSAIGKHHLLYGKDAKVEKPLANSEKDKHDDVCKYCVGTGTDWRKHGNKTKEKCPRCDDGLVVAKASMSKSENLEKAIVKRPEEPEDIMLHNPTQWRICIASHPDDYYYHGALEVNGWKQVYPSNETNRAYHVKDFLPNTSPIEEANSIAPLHHVKEIHIVKGNQSTPRVSYSVQPHNKSPIFGKRKFVVTPYVLGQRGEQVIVHDEKKHPERILDKSEPVTIDPKSGKKKTCRCPVYSFPHRAGSHPKCENK